MRVNLGSFRASVLLVLLIAIDHPRPTLSFLLSPMWHTRLLCAPGCASLHTKLQRLHQIALGSTSSKTPPDPSSSPIIATRQVPEGVALPLPEALHTLYPEEYPSMSKARKIIRKDQVFVNGELKSCQDAVKGGDVIEVHEIVSRVPPKKDKFGNAKVKAMRVVYEDDHLAVVVKPAGITVHGHGPSSLVDRYAEVLIPTTVDPEDALDKPVHVHRLDAPVGGLLIVVKTKTAQKKLSRAFAERTVQKRYRAILLGRLEGEGRVTVPVEEKESTSLYKVVSVTPSSAYGDLTTVDLYPETGRKHQLRIHMASLGTPILGDLRYGPDGSDQLKSRGLFLHALGLRFRHPVDDREMVLDIEEPEIFGNTRNREINFINNMQKSEESEELADAAA